MHNTEISILLPFQIEIKLNDWYCSCMLFFSSARATFGYKN